MRSTSPDLHVWRAGSDRYACLVSLITAADVDADLVRNALHIREQLVHVTVGLEHPALGGCGSPVPQKTKAAACRGMPSSTGGL